jgi:subtilisin family serine protease
MRMLPVLILLNLMACAPQINKQRLSLGLESTKSVSVILMGVDNPEEIKRASQQLGIKVSGQHLLVLEGPAAQIEQLQFVTGKDFDYLLDAPLDIEKPLAFKADADALYLAKKDFGLLEFWQAKPQADGRGVIMGVIDDGISPHQRGLDLTSTGERKLLRKASQSSFSTFELVPVKGGHEVIVNEDRPSFSKDKLDLNADGEINQWKLFIPEGKDLICLDEVCKPSFSSSGEYFHAKDPRFVLVMELNREENKLQIFQPERGGDSHGEGVAAVMAGHRIGGLAGFDGVAPGAQLLDYDLSEQTDVAEEQEYSISTFIKSLEWLGSQGAEIANISYSLFFTSARTQVFMEKALNQIIEKHNMVISFSAGNNGPGLGSLNRRSIYPASSLVAGAFVSKELDEYVHGVTGLPEEGRVVFYSSRGPGQGIGPTLISPLSSLTNSTPDEGHRAFSGTSSAAPALAGAAAVLISAIKQEGLKYDAATVVHALRLSGKRLQAEPFIFQGMGLPQVARALELYRRLISGQAPMHVEVSVDAETQDGAPLRGLFLRTSEHGPVVSRRVSLKGILSKLSPADAQVNTLTPIRIIYSNGITGARQLWISRANSAFFIDINLKEVLAGKTEGFGEIRLVSSESNELLTVIPVTVVQDANVRQRPSTVLTVRSQEGVRFPLQVPAGVRGIIIKTEILEGDDRNALLSVFDNNQIRLFQQRPGADHLVAVTPGFYQIAVSQRGGTARTLKIRVSVEVPEVQLRTQSTASKEANVLLRNNGSPFSGILKLTPVPEVIERNLLSSAELSKGASISRTLAEGQYLLELASARDFDLAYLYASCSTREEKEDGSVELRSGTSFTLKASTSTVTARCMPFDLGGLFEETYLWEMRLLKQGKAREKRVDLTRGQSQSVKFENLAPGTYQVELQEPFRKSGMELGRIEVIGGAEGN